MYYIVSSDGMLNILVFICGECSNSVVVGSHLSTFAPIRRKEDSSKNGYLHFIASGSISFGFAINLPHESQTDARPFRDPLAP